MHYLECLAILQYVLTQLEASSRKQVPVEVLQELKATTVDLASKLAYETEIKILMAIRALQEALGTCTVPPGTQYLSDRMKVALVDGFEALQTEVSLVAFNYFKVNDFEPTEPIINIMRGVVTVAAQKGLV